MATSGAKTLPEFNHENKDTNAPNWEQYKRDFLIHLDALGLHDKPGRRKVGLLLSNMGRESVKIYDSFVWNVVDDTQEDQYNLETVFSKFDQHFGVHTYRNIKRQEFLNTKRGNSSIMDFIAELKRKAEHCQYGEQKEGFICDMVINGVHDPKCSEKLMEIPADELTLERVMKICRQVELTTAHLKNLSDLENPKVNVVHSRSGHRGATGRFRGGLIGYRSRGRGRYEEMRNNNNKQYCKWCCRHHEHKQCPAYNKKCDVCGRTGHFKKSTLCRGRGYGRPRSRGFRYRGNPRSQVNYMDEEDDGFNRMMEQCTVQDVFNVKCSDSKQNDEWVVDLKVHDQPLTVEIDSGARCNVICRDQAEQFWPIKIEHSDTIIRGVSGSPVRTIGQIVLPCTYKGVERQIQFQVLDSIKTNLLGRVDCKAFGLIERVNKVTVGAGNSTEQLLREYKDVVNKDIGCLPGEYTIKIDSNVTPVVHAPRPVPAALRDQVKEELDHLEKCGIIKQVEEPTEWVSSMVCVRKKNGRVRICIDPTDLNKAILREHFPMNSIDDIVLRVNGSKVFSTLDANMGYYQIKLDESSSLLTTFNTPFGRYRYLRLPMGLKCASEVFQREMCHHFGKLDGVEIVVDDLLVHGDDNKHNERLRGVLDKARQVNLKFNIDKCVFAQDEVDYVGHTLTGDGLKPTKQRLEAITELKDPENHAELETVLGMLAYVSKFIPNLSELTEPLRELKKQELWEWSDKAKNAFERVKEALISTKVLKYYDVNKPIKLTVDASMKGLGAAVVQDDRVVAYASRTLTQTETRYAQIEKEMLAVVFGCERFHKLIYGKTDVTIESDHKPLESILQKPFHKAPMRLQKMMLKLQPYQFKLVHVKGKDIGLADCLSRMTVKQAEGEPTIDDEMMVLTIETLAGVSHESVAKATSKDETMCVLKQVICNGWPENRSEVPAEVLPYYDFRDELSTYNGVVYRGERTCIPTELRPATLKTIHSSHQGIVRCKQRARELVFWPGMNSQIEEVVSRCNECLEKRNKPQKEPMVLQPVPNLPWSKVGTDLCEVNGNHYLVMVDYYSNFIEVAPLKNDTRASTVIARIKENIARYGIMDTLISDNGPQFASEEFKVFTVSYGINHITSSPLHQQANGLAEKAVQTVKRIISKCYKTGEDVYLSLLELRNTPRDSEIGSPTQRLMGRRAKTLLPITDNLRKPAITDPQHVQSRLMGYRVQQKHYYDRGAKARDDLKPGDAIRIQTPEGWKPAECVRPATYPRKSVNVKSDECVGTTTYPRSLEKCGGKPNYPRQCGGLPSYPRSYIVKAGDMGREYRRNTKHLMKTHEFPHKITPKYKPISIPTFAPKGIDIRSNVKRVPDANPQPDKPRTDNDVTRSRSGREIRRPKHLDDYV